MRVITKYTPRDTSNAYNFHLKTEHQKLTYYCKTYILGREMAISIAYMLTRVLIKVPSGYLFVEYILGREMAISVAYMLTRVLIKVPPGSLLVAVKLKQVQSSWV